MAPSPPPPDRLTAARAAVGEYRAALGEDFEASAVAYAAGRVLAAAGSPEAALEAWLGALDAPHARGWPTLMNALAETALALGQAEAVSARLDRHADRLPELFLWQGHLLLASDAPDRALGPLLRAFEQTEGALRFTAANEAMRALIALDRLDEALALCARAAAALPDYAVNLRVSEAGLLSRAGRPEEALARLDALLAQAPALGIAWLNRGAALLRLGRPAEARAALARAAQLDPGTAEAGRRLLGADP